MHRMVLIWVLADQLMDSRTKRFMVSQLYLLIDRLWEEPFFAIEAVRSIYQNTPGPCGIRDLFVDALVHFHENKNNPPPEIFNQAGLHSLSDAPEMPHVFLVDVVASLISRKSPDIMHSHGPPCSGLCSEGSREFHDYMEKYQIGLRNSAQSDSGEGIIRHCACCFDEYRPM